MSTCDVLPINFDKVGSGGLLTTVDDFLAWDHNFDKPGIGSAQFLEQLLTPGRLLDGSRQDYAFGLRIDRLYDSSEHLKKITPVELHVLKLVCERPDLILKEIREELGIPQSTLTSAIDRLEKRGLVRRVISDRDRRSFVPEVTAAGRRVQKEHDRIDEQVAARLLDLLDTEEEREAFLRMLTKISKKLAEE